MAITPLTTGLAAAGLVLALGGGALVASPALASSETPTATASAASPTPGSTAGPKATGAGKVVGERREKACARIPKALERTAKVTARLEADASTKGSLAWLQVRIDKADAAGKKDLAQLLRQRLAIRKSLLSVLPERTTWLTDLQSKVCNQLPAEPAPTTTS